MEKQLSPHNLDLRTEDFWAMRCETGTGPSVLPAPSSRHPLHDVHQPEEHRNLDQSTDRRRQSLVAMGPESGDGHRNRQLEVIAGRRETLRGPESVPKATPVRRVQRHEEDDNEVYGKRDGDPDDRHDLVDDLMPLIREEDNDSI